MTGTLRDDTVNAVLDILSEAEMLPYRAHVQDYIPEGRTGTSEEFAALKVADRDADEKNREFAARIARAVLEASCGVGQ